jgi:1-deoxy-D-xylulose-5-phosphate reductoisomerase
MTNKGLEVIEAHHLFNLDYEKIKVVVHPQSCVHSMVAYHDGSVKAHLGVSDMRIPIQYALSYPERWQVVDASQELDFCKLDALSFAPPDLEVFGCLRLAMDAGRLGGTMPAAMNAANEVAVAAFISQEIGFLDIERVIEVALDTHDRQPIESIEQLIQIDRVVRARASEEVKCLK